MLRRLSSLLFWAFLVVSSALLFPVALVLWAVTRPFDHRTRALHLFTCWWASLYTWLNPWWPVTVTGRERIPDGPCVLVANHLSLLDILVLFRLSTPFTWVSKAENFRVPFIGWNMRLNRYIALRRGDRASVLRMLEQCEAALRDGTPVMMFPEGTRSQDGLLRPFKPGGVRARAAHGRAGRADRRAAAPATPSPSAASCCADGTRSRCRCSTRCRPVPARRRTS